MEQIQALEAPQEQQEPQQPPLTPEERHDLRNRVNAGYKMSVEEARRVYETLRTGQGAVVITGESTKSKRKPKKEAYADAALDADLKDLGLDV